MKKVHSLLRWPCLLQDVLNRRFAVLAKPATVAPKPSPIISSFLEIGPGKKTVDAAKICGGAKMLLKQKPSKHS